jgi:hypothetical protein
MRKHLPISKVKKKRKGDFQNKGPETSPNEIANQPKNPFDFGGLSIQDLKKNLGCG